MRWRALVVLLTGSGVWIGEARGLEVGDVDFLRCTVRVERQRLQSGDVAPLKSKATRRTVPVGQVVIDELAAHLAAYPAKGPLFVDELGDPLSYGRWKRVLTAATRVAGVDVTGHSFPPLRCLGVEPPGSDGEAGAGVPGHSSPVIASRTYAHLRPGDEDRTRNVLDAALGPLTDSLRTEGASNS